MAAKVLLVEDDRALREALSDTLLLGGHEFVAVDSAEAALPVLAARRARFPVGRAGRLVPAVPRAKFRVGRAALPGRA